MDDGSKGTPRITVGVDLGDRYSYLCFLVPACNSCANFVFRVQDRIWVRRLQRPTRLWANLLKRQRGISEACGGYS
jgi:hypothetical protein